MNPYLEGAPAAVFDHPLNIHVGAARVIFARSVTVPSGDGVKTHPEGWVLPGGRRVIDYSDALAAANRINDMIVRYNTLKGNA